MPTYDYLCQGCGHAFEHFQSMSSKRLRKCPQCGERKLERLVGSGAGVIFKGSGFYETDYKRAGSLPPSESGDDGGSSEGGSDTKKTSGSDAPSKTDGDSAKGGSGSSKDD